MAPLSRKRMLAGSAISALAVIAVGTMGAQAFASGGAESKLMAKVQAHFPNTKISGVRCKSDHAPKGLCEVTAGAQVLYVSPDARYAVVGSILDLEQKVDLTDRRLRELAAVESATGKFGGGAAGIGIGAGAAAAPSAPSGPAAAPVAGPAGPEAPTKINVTLPAANAIVHNPGAATKMAVFTDLNCSYCNKLMAELKDVKDIEIHEFPIGVLGPESVEKAKMALCATDRVAASNALYFGGEVKVTGDCADAVKKVQENEAFAQANGISGTPAIVRADGTMNPGYMPLAQLRAFLAG